MQALTRHKFKLLFIAAVLAGCGGGGGSDTTSGNNGGNTGGNNPPSGDALLTAACTDSDYLCSGREIQRLDNGVALTANGVQVYGLSTSDLDRASNPNHTIAAGLMLPDCSSAGDCGVGEVRKQRTENGRVVLLLDRLGVSWDRRTERPMIIDTFSPVMGRATIDSNNVVRFRDNLPLPSDLSFYDWAVRGASGTQGNYANNVYFPRNWPTRCTEGWPDCPDTETSGISHRAGDWRSGGLQPDSASAQRYHGEGDMRAGDNTPDPVTQERRWIPESNGAGGFGPAYAGFKGYRTINNFSYQYANLATWLTADTVNIVEWVTDGQPDYEHVKFRRGMVAYGDPTTSSSVPGSGIVTYTGRVYGQYVSSPRVDITSFTGDVSVTVNYATGQASIQVTNTRADNSSGNAVPVSFTSSAALDPAGSGLRNYASGAATANGMLGGISARLFGPDAAEIGGTFSMDNATGQTAMAGFIARRR